MRWACVAVAVVFAAAGRADEKADKALEPFQGAWSVVSITNNGTDVPDDEVKKLTLTVKGKERVIADGDDVKSKATFAVDEGKKPKTIDITVSEGPLAGKTYRGIYELKDDTLTICLTLDGDGRPADLTAKEGSKQLLQVFKKKDAKAKP